MRDGAGARWVVVAALASAAARLGVTWTAGIDAIEAYHWYYARHLEL